MGRTPGTEHILDAAARWTDRCLLTDGSVFSDAALWTRDHVKELVEHFVEKPDPGSRNFLEKLHDQLAPATPAARRLAAEMLWTMFLFPNNVSAQRKIEVVRAVWRWSGDELDTDDPMFGPMAPGIGSGGQGFNTYRPFELEFFIRLMDGPPRLYLFDPKYKLDGEAGTGTAEVSRPLKADIDKMHTYRDAIRDSHGERVVRYAAILYPGKTRRFDPGLEAICATPSSAQSLHSRLAEVLEGALS